MRKSGPECECGVNDAEGGEEHEEEEVMPQLMRKMSAQSVNGMRPVTVQPPEKCKKPSKPVSPIKVHRKPKTTAQEALKAIPPLLTLVMVSHNKQSLTQLLASSSDRVHITLFPFFSALYDVI